MTTTTTTPPPMSTTGLDTRPRRYSFFDYDLDVVQDALLNPHLSEYQDHFGFRIQVKTDDEYDDDTSEDEVDLDNSNSNNEGDDDGPTDTSHDTQSHSTAIPLQLGMKAASPSSSSSITTTTSTTSSSSADEDDDYTDIDIDTAITTPTATKHSHLSEPSLLSEGEVPKLDTNGYPQQRRRSSTVSGIPITPPAYSKSSPSTAAPLSKPYRRPRAMSYSVTQTTPLADDKGITSAPPPSNHTIMHGSYTPPISTTTIATTTKIKAPPSRPLSTATSLSRHPSVERPSDVFRNRQSKRLSLHRTGSIALSSSTPHNEDSAQQLALKEEVSNNLAQLKEASPDIYDWEFWATVINDFDMVKQQQHISLRDYVCVGMPPSLRGMIWQVVSKSRHNSDTIELEYNALLKMVSPHEKIIQRDLARTFPTHTFFRHSEEGGGQEMLFNVIKAYSLYDPQVGYCQGLPFVVGCLLLHMPDEAAFCVLINLMNDYGLRGHFTPKMELLHERMFQFDELLLVHLPQVHRHLDAQGVRPTMYASQWFMTLFAYRCPLDLVFRVLDMVFTEGTSIILNVALALMKKNQATLLSLEFEGLLGFLGTDIFDVYEHDTNGFVKDAFDFCIAPRDLAKLTKRYTVKAAQEAKIQDKEDHLRQENYELSQRAKKLEKSYEALTFEHQELTRQVVAAKMTMASASDENQSLRHTIAHLEHCIKHTKQLTEESQLDTFHHLAHENATLVQRNVQLEDHLAEVEMTLIDFKMKYAQSENEYEQMKKMLGQIKRFSS